MYWMSINNLLCSLGVTVFCAHNSTSPTKTTSISLTASTSSTSARVSTLAQTNASATSSSMNNVISEVLPIIPLVGPDVIATPLNISPFKAGNAVNTTAAFTPGSLNVSGTILVIARDTASVKVATSGLNGYGIPFEPLIVPASGTTLPTLNSSATAGNYGGIVVASEVSYDTGGGVYASALTTGQWNTLYAYQIAFGVRMVQYDVYPGPDFGTTEIGSCCDAGVEQLISFTNTDAFKQAGIKIGATMSTINLWHYGASISNTSTTTQIAEFAANNVIASPSTAAVINNFNGREQMAFFTTWATDWSPTSAWLQHAWITWVTRGIHAGFRRTYLGTQIDDIFLETGLYSPANTNFRIRAADMTGIKSWISTINGKMNPGSNYFMELGHNGNGNIEAATATATGATACGGGAIEYPDVVDTSLEFQKPLGTGVDVWPKTPVTYSWTTACTDLDSLKIWFATAANRDTFAHISHTFTHLELNNATYSDASKEISFNKDWFAQTSIGSGTRFTSNGLIPPAITGLHNGDVIRAWADNGLKHGVGDNTRPVLRNPTNEMWPLYTNVAANGYDGYEIIPRWATRIYYNCDKPDCTTQEWIATSAGKGTFSDLLAVEKADTTRHMMGLFHDPYMFHQANLRNTDVDPITINGAVLNISIFQAWVETVVQEFVRLVNWPILTIKQGDLATSFADRMTRDACGYKISYAISSGKITGVTVSAKSNICSVPIPVTFPGPVTNTQGFTTEQVGNDPLTVWTRLSGAPVSFTLSSPVSVA